MILSEFNHNYYIRNGSVVCIKDDILAKGETLDEDKVGAKIFLENGDLIVTKMRRGEYLKMITKINSGYEVFSEIVNS
jgi:hypothetical protein